jgi:hypothetical protein
LFFGSHADKYDEIKLLKTHLPYIGTNAYCLCLACHADVNNKKALSVATELSENRFMTHLMQNVPKVSFKKTVDPLKNSGR